MVISGNAVGSQAAGPGNWSNAPLFTTVARVDSATRITLSSRCAPAMDGINTAQWDLGTDNTLALQNCLATPGATPRGLTCTVPAGAYLVSGAPPTYDSRVYLHGGSQLRCDAGAVFVFPHHDTYIGTGASFLNIASSASETISGAIISGCTIVGTDLRFGFTQSIEFNYPIAISGAWTAQNQVINNTIRNGWSDGEIVLTYGAAQTLISGNRISDCGFNGITIISGTQNTIEHNILTDCSIDIEPTSNIPTNGPVRENLLRYNTITQLNRAPPLGQVVMFSTCTVEACESIEGRPTGADTIVVVNNILVNAVQIYPFCRKGRMSQTWFNNIARRSTGEPCVPGAAGCAAFAQGSCTHMRRAFVRPFDAARP